MRTVLYTHRVQLRALRIECFVEIREWYVFSKRKGIRNIFILCSNFSTEK